MRSVWNYFGTYKEEVRVSQGAQRLRICLPMQETQEQWVQSLGREDTLEKEMTTHSSIPAWKIPWIEKPAGLLSLGHKESDTTESLSTHKKEAGSRSHGWQVEWRQRGWREKIKASVKQFFPLVWWICLVVKALKLSKCSTRGFQCWPIYTSDSVITLASVDF